MSFFSSTFHTDDCEFSTVFCEKTQKLVNMQAFVLAAKYHSVPDLEVCTPLEQMLEALNGKQEGRSGILEFILHFKKSQMAKNC